MYGKFKTVVLGHLAHVTPSVFFSRFLRSEAFFFQNSHSTEIIRHLILRQTLLFLTRLPARQDGVENRDKVYFSERITERYNYEQDREKRARVKIIYIYEPEEGWYGQPKCCYKKQYTLF